MKYLILILSLVFLGGCTSSDEVRFIREGDIVVHKLSRNECLMRDIGYPPNAAPIVSDYSMGECVDASESAKWVHLSEYELIPEDK